jgi:hypothetical protein
MIEALKDLFMAWWHFACLYPGYAISFIIIDIIAFIFFKGLCDEELIKKDHVPWFW